MSAVIEQAKQTKQQMAIFPILKSYSHLLDKDNPSCPFHNYVGNEDAVSSALSIAKKCFNSHKDIGLAAGKWHEPIYACTRDYPVRMLLTGPRSVGKTTFAKCYAGTVSINWAATNVPVESTDPLWKLPFIELDGTGLKNRDEIFKAIESAYRSKGLPLLPVHVAGGVRHYKLSPGIIFVDEIQGLKRQLMEGMLKMTERHDGILEVGVTIRVDCRQATFIAGTTNPGALKDTLLSRFPIRLELKQHSLEQVAEIIANAYNWPKQECLALAEMKPLPREALAVASLVDDTRKQEGITLRAAMKQWVENLGMKKGGLNDKAIDVLVILRDAQPHGMSKENICASLTIEKDEFQKQILPQLLRTAMHPAFVSVSARHKITQAGLDELNARNL